MAGVPGSAVTTETLYPFTYWWVCEASSLSLLVPNLKNPPPEVFTTLPVPRFVVLNINPESESRFLLKMPYTLSPTVTSPGVNSTDGEPVPPDLKNTEGQSPLSPILAKAEPFSTLIPALPAADEDTFTVVVPSDAVNDPPTIDNPPVS